jgi:hypothetical protein
MRFGLNDLTDLPKVEDMADVLGFEIPGLSEAGPSDQLLPLDVPEEAPQAPEALDGPLERGPGQDADQGQDADREPDADLDPDVDPTVN